MSVIIMWLMEVKAIGMPSEFISQHIHRYFYSSDMALTSGQHWIVSLLF